MGYLARVSIKAKLLIIIGCAFMGFAVFSLSAFSTMNRLRVFGPEYQRLMNEKDLLADTIPPYGYIQEAMLDVFLVTEGSLGLKEFEAKIAQIDLDHRTCCDRWRKILPGDSVRKAFIEGAEPPARDFFRCVGQQLLPLLHQGDLASAKKLIDKNGTLTRSYVEHARHMDEAVSGTQAKLANIENQLVSLTKSRTYFLYTVLFAMTLAVGGVSAWTFRSIAAQESANLEHVAKSNAISNTMCFVEFTPNGEIAAVNENFAKLMGYAEADLRGKHHFMLMAKDGLLSNEHRQFWEKLAGGESIIAEVARYDSRGNLRYLQASYNPILDKNGKVVKIVKYAYDITSQVVQREELQSKSRLLVEVVEAASHGDLTKPITISGSDALGRVGEGLHTFVSQLTKNLRNISDNATALASASEELGAVSTQMSSNAHETSSQANVVSAASEQVSQNVQTVSMGVEELNSAIREIAKNAADAARISQEAVSVASATNVTVQKLGDSSAEIGKVIKVINSIAEQTNLLALNATIEAARAGEAGKGFAVVANEVKELAKETAKATEDISRKIEAIQSDALGAVEAIKQIGDVIHHVNDISSTIASAVEEQTATAKEMGRNVMEASAGTQEIAKNIASVASVSMDTSDGASSVQQASCELSRMANELQSLVANFKIDASSATKIPTPKIQPSASHVFASSLPSFSLN